MKRSEVLKLRGIIEKAVQSLNDETALQAVSLHPAWAAGVEYAAGMKVQHNGKLWRVLQAHTSQEGWQPKNAASLWEQINETNSGTLEDPIPYSGNMSLENGKYYTQDDVLFLCTRDTGAAVHNALADLVGLYVEAV